MTLMTHDCLRLSDRAQAKIRQLMKSSGHDRDTVRVLAERSAEGVLEVGLAFDSRREQDVSLSAEGVDVVVDAKTLEIAQDSTLDYGTEGFTLARDLACETLAFSE